MPGINQATVGDGYTAAATVQDVFTSTGGWFSVSTQAVVLQLQWGPNASGSRWSDEQTLGAGAFGTIPPGCTGLRFRNLVAGKTATVTAFIGSGGPPPDPRGNVWPEPALAISALGTVTAVASSPTTRQVFVTVGAGTYALPDGCRAILVECVGGGGGGGGCASSAGAAGIGGGGGGGGYATKVISNPAASYALVVGDGGNGGAAGANPGAAGQASTFGAGPLASAPGGSGGSGGAATSAGVTQGGAGGSGAVGDTGSEGGSGGAGKVTLATEAFGGAGGNAAGPYGGGIGTEQALAGTVASPGVAGHQFGGGGSGGAQTNNAGAQAGGKGSKGIIVVTEFY